MNLLASGLLLEIVALCTISAYVFVNAESLLTLLIFDFLFLTLTFYLHGSLPQKLGLLAIGNVVGLLCNLLFYAVQVVGLSYFGVDFNILYKIAYPLLNLLWIVSFWSFSLSALPKPQEKRERETK